MLDVRPTLPREHSVELRRRSRPCISASVTDKNSRGRRCDLSLDYSFRICREKRSNWIISCLKASQTILWTTSDSRRHFLFPPTFLYSTGKLRDSVHRNFGKFFHDKIVESIIYRSRYAFFFFFFSSDIYVQVQERRIGNLKYFVKYSKAPDSSRPGGWWDTPILPSSSSTTWY